MSTRQGEDGRIRDAVIGLGWFAQVAVLPAFAHAENARLVALFSGDGDKRSELGAKYAVEGVHDYDAFDAVLAGGGIDAVYVATPNHRHKAFAVRAAWAGVHILCEKPLAVTESDCREMIGAARDNQVKLMTGYRLHFEEATLRALDIVRSGAVGEPLLFNSRFANRVHDEQDIRLGPVDQGGGSLYDIGIYCINAARHLFRAEPEEVVARAVQDDATGCDRAAAVTLRFPGDRLASFTTSFDGEDHDGYEIIGRNGFLRVEPAYGFDTDLGHRLEAGGEVRTETFPKRDQVAAELVYFSSCILNDADPEPDGVEGLADVRIIEALHRSWRQARAIRLGPFATPARPTMAQAIRRPPAEKPELVKTAHP